MTSPANAQETTLRERTQEISAEYWSARDEQTERVAVAQLVLAFAAAEARLAGSVVLSREDAETIREALKSVRDLEPWERAEAVHRWIDGALALLPRTQEQEQTSEEGASE